jgi:glycine dehydrogenase
MVLDLTGCRSPTRQLLDEGTAAAEAMAMCRRVLGRKREKRFVAAPGVPPADAGRPGDPRESMGVELLRRRPGDLQVRRRRLRRAGPVSRHEREARHSSGTLARIHGAGAIAWWPADLLALTLLEAPGELRGRHRRGQRAAFRRADGLRRAARGVLGGARKYKRKMPGRIVGVSVDRTATRRYRLTLQTREQHIRREKATSNICTAQVLLAIMASMYGVYHGPEGLRRIADRVRA